MTTKRWTTGHKAVACVVLASSGFLGMSTAASAAPAQAVSHTVTASTQAEALSSAVNATPGRVAPAPSIGGDSSVSSQRGKLDSVVAAIKRIPGLFSTVVQGAKKVFSWFNANVWPKVKAAIGVISNLVTAWEIWQLFH